jgi:hypothetical protein
MDAKDKTPQDSQKLSTPQRRLTKVHKEKLRKTLLQDIFEFGGCKAVSAYSLTKFLNQKVLIYGEANSVLRKNVVNYFYYFSRQSRERLLLIKTELEAYSEYSSEEEEEEDRENEVSFSPQRLHSPSLTPPGRPAAAPERRSRLTQVTFPTMSDSKGKQPHPSKPLMALPQTHLFFCC